MTQQHPYTVMTVCTGNICRSPMAEIILRAEFESRGIGEDRVRVLSSGVSDEEYGHPIDPRAVRVLRADGYEIPTHHFAHRVTREEIEETDLFLPMTASHMRALLRQLPSSKRAEVHMYRSFDPNLPSRRPAARTPSTWWIPGMAGPTSSRWPSARFRRSRRTSSIGWNGRSDDGMRPAAGAWRHATRCDETRRALA